MVYINMWGKTTVIKGVFFAYVINTMCQGNQQISALNIIIVLGGKQATSSKGER